MTTQRRPHWDDDLVRTVADLIQHGEQGVMDYVHRAHIIIAAVEDWHKAKRDARVRTHSAECWRWHQECAEYRIEKLSAQVQAVRAVADAWEYYASENGNVRTAWAASSVREALDGDA